MNKTVKLALFIAAGILVTIGAIFGIRYIVRRSKGGAVIPASDTYVAPAGAGAGSGGVAENIKDVLSSMPTPVAGGKLVMAEYTSNNRPTTESLADIKKGFTLTGKMDKSGEYLQVSSYKYGQYIDKKAPAGTFLGQIHKRNIRFL